MGWRAILAWLVVAAPATAQQVVDLPAEDRWLELDFEELYRVGSAVTGEAWEQFGEIWDVAFDGAGHLYILDRQARLVYVVGGDGRLIRESGGPGEGPGEFAETAAMAVFNDGRVVVGDPSRRGYHVFAAGGEFERMVRLAEPGVEFSPEFHWGVLPDGGVAFSDSTAYAVKVAESSAGIVRILTRPFEPEPVTGRVIRAEKDRRLRRLAETNEPGTDLPARRRGIEELQFHTELSVIRGLGTTWDGHIWVLRRGDGPNDDGPVDVLAPDGRYLGSYPAGTTALPAAFGPDGLVAIVERNELGVQTVTVKRVVSDVR